MAITQDPRRKTLNFANVSRDKLPAMASFENVLVQGYTRPISPGVHWPNFSAGGFERHFRNGAPICQPPEPQKEPPTRFRGDAVFLGANGFHFGHNCAEIVPRFLQSRKERPDLPFIMTGRLGHPEDTSPTPAMTSLLAWFGFDEQRVKVITTPTVFDRLHTAAQAESLNSGPPCDEYLDMLDSLFEENAMESIPTDYLYVSRAKLQPGYGMHAGERYLCTLLEAAGVKVLYPERKPLRHQLALYAGAKRLIFAEGSALHGRQLLGRFSQDIDVLVRRENSKMAVNQLAPRCDRLTHVSANYRNLTYTTQSGKADMFLSLSLYNVEAVLSFFESIGIPLKSLWDRNSFSRSQDEAILAWIRGIHSKRNKQHVASGTGDHLIEQLAEEGFGHLEAGVRDVIATCASIDW